MVTDGLVMPPQIEQSLMGKVAILRDHYASVLMDEFWQTPKGTWRARLFLNHVPIKFYYSPSRQHWTRA